ncbi:cold shock domain-containing protein [Dokdonia sinensis]|uniref:Cold shock domain-containing protein n=1 Tax=Dokdonia sinensis TaxID=2479847 RepID=A0A3M0G4E9_9FLAO|nr:cold shock domain-containing protein [Dokdonia sinensis]RMB59448.1 cold shock domain-containing protein [Dokdonia sinensis]
MILDFFKKLFGGSSETTGDRKEGTVKFFNTRKGFGFITVNGSNEEIFAHTTNVIGRIKEGNKVTFEIEQSEKGPTAVKVKKVK